VAVRAGGTVAKRKIQKSRKPSEITGFSATSPAGFEPATFGLGILSLPVRCVFYQCFYECFCPWWYTESIVSGAGGGTAGGTVAVRIRFCGWACGTIQRASLAGRKAGIRTACPSHFRSRLSEVEPMAKRAPTIYPKPEPVTPDDRQASEQRAQIERWRWDLERRLGIYHVALVERLGGYAGVSAEMPFAEVLQRLAKTVEPDDAVQRDSWLALRKLVVIHECLLAIQEIPVAVSVALCAAMDLGQLLQRQQVQIDVGEHVDVGRRNSAGRVKASAKRQASCDAEREAAFREYLRLRKAGGRTKHHTATLQNMAKAAKGELSFGTLKRWATADDWNQKYLTSSK